MSSRTLNFQQPNWRPGHELPVHTGGLLLGTLAWIGLYGWLSYRVWTLGLNRGLMLNLLLTALCILLGVSIGLGWRMVGRRWRTIWRELWHKERWQPLSLEQLRLLTPSDFEAYVARLFERQGYKVVNARDTKDGGVDVLLTDSDGHQAIVQCKRYQQNVGEPAVRDLYGTMIHTGATHAFLITTAGFSEEAKRWAQGKEITLIDGRRLVELARAEPAA